MNECALQQKHHLHLCLQQTAETKYRESENRCDKTSLHNNLKIPSIYCQTCFLPFIHTVSVVEGPSQNILFTLHILIVETEKNEHIILSVLKFITDNKKTSMFQCITTKEKKTEKQKHENSNIIRFLSPCMYATKLCACNSQQPAVRPSHCGGLTASGARRSGRSVSQKKTRNNFYTARLTS